MRSNDDAYISQNENGYACRDEGKTINQCQNFRNKLS